MFNCWFQKPDYESEELGKLSKEEVVAYFRGIDRAKWDKETRRREEAKEEFCPYGFGLNGENGEFVHIYYDGPGVGGPLTVLVEKRSKKKLLGLIPCAGKASRYIEGKSFEECPAVIEKAYDDFEGLFEFGA